MQFVLGTFLYNALCAVVPCHPVYQPPQPIPIPVPHVVPQFYEVISSSPSGSFSRSVPQYYAPYHRPKQRSNGHPPRETPPTPVGTLSSSVKIPILKSPFVVSTQSGKVEGFPMKTVRSRNIIAFTSIPYAEKPIGQLCYAVRTDRLQFANNNYYHQSSKIIFLIVIVERTRFPKSHGQVY